MSCLIRPGQVVVFQGDSITDCGRDRDDRYSLGSGYPLLIQSWFDALHPYRDIEFINKGISGDRVAALENRWTEDCISLRPNWVSILIGINEVWRRYDSNDPTSVEKYESGFRTILNRINNETSAEIILLEPFVLPTPPDRITWREDLDPKIDVVRSLAEEFKALLVPLDAIFTSLGSSVDPAAWAEDGVHPTLAGHSIIAGAWLEAIGAGEE